MNECSFCKIVKGKLPSINVYEDENVLAFAPLKEHIIAKGHLVVIPKKHYVDIYDISQKNLNNIMKVVKTISQRLREKYNADGINILHASGKVAQQSCFHFHIHLIPRYKNDSLDTWPKTGYKESNFPKVYKDLKKLV